MVHLINMTLSQHSVHVHNGLIQESEVEQPVLFPLVNAGDQTHFTVTFGSSIGDERLVLRGEWMLV